VALRANSYSSSRAIVVPLLFRLLRALLLQVIRTRLPQKQSLAGSSISGDFGSLISKRTIIAGI